MTAARRTELKALINDLRPTSIEPLASILSKADMTAIRTMNAMGHFMRCADTGRFFVPALCTRA